MSIAALVAACYSAACRPPRSGGTGGSSPRGSAPTVTSPPRASASSKAAKPPKGRSAWSADLGKSVHNETEFTRTIRAAIDAEPALKKRMSTAESIEKMNRDHESKKQRIIDEYEKTLRSGYFVHMGMRIAGPRYESSPANKQTETAVHQAIAKLRNDPSLKPTNPVEEAAAKILAAYDKGGPFGHYPLSISVNLPDGNGKIVEHYATIRRKQEPTKRLSHNDKQIEDEKEFEAASTRVGALINSEIDRRVQERLSKVVMPDFERIKTEVSSLSRPGMRVELNKSGKRLDVYQDTDEMNKLPAEERRAAWAKASQELNDLARSPEFVAMEKKIREANLQSNDPNVHRSLVEQDIEKVVYREVMREVRPMGGIYKGTPDHRKGKGTYSSHEQAMAAANRLPSDWIDASNAERPVNFRATKDRAHYEVTVNEVTLDGDIGTAVHELTHRAEVSVAGMYQMERAFYDRRTAGESLEKLKKLDPGGRYKSDEVARPDRFFHPYCGKEYDFSAFELLSMGIEKIATGQRKVSGMDDDYANFVLGALATLGRET